jgi:hypothetical protein
MGMTSPRRECGLALMSSATLLLSGCFSMETTVGRGPQHAPATVEYHQRWFALYGLWPMDDFDSKSLAGDSRDYRVTTAFTFSDVVMSTLTSFVTFYRQTVTIEK